MEEKALAPPKKKKQSDKSETSKKGGGGTGHAINNEQTQWDIKKFNKMQDRKKKYQEVIMQAIGDLIKHMLKNQGNSAAEIHLVVMQSPLLPVLEGMLRSGSVVEMAKNNQFNKSCLEVIEAFSGYEDTLALVEPIGPDFEPSQLQSVSVLLEAITTTADVFLSCINGEAEAGDSAAEDKDDYGAQNNNDYDDYYGET